MFKIIRKFLKTPRGMKTWNFSNSNPKSVSRTCFLSLFPLDQCVGFIPRLADIRVVREWVSEVAQSCLTLWDPMDTRLLRSWDFLGKSTGVGCHLLLWGIFLTQGLNLGLPYCRQTLYRLSHQESKMAMAIPRFPSRPDNSLLTSISLRNKKFFPKSPWADLYHSFSN